MKGRAVTLVGTFVLTLCLTCRADILLSGFSLAENPFIYAGFFGSLTTNPDGTQTLANSGTAWGIAAFSPVADVTGAGSNHSVSLRARLEPPHEARTLRLQFRSPASEGMAVAEIPYGAFEVGTFKTVTIRFSDFTFQPNGFNPPKPELVLLTVEIIDLVGSTDDQGLVHGITFDSLYAIPEPRTLALIICASLIVWPARRRHRAGL